MNNKDRIEILKEFIRNDSADTFSKYLLALEFIKADEYESALKFMEEIYLQDPDYLPNYYHFGKVLEKVDSINKAIQIYNEGILIAKKQSDRHTQSELENALELCED